MNHIQELLINLLCILLPIFLFQVFWEDRPTGSPRRARLFALLMAAASLLLCMMFPVAAYPGFLFDLRLIPFLLATLYDGPLMGSALLALLLAFRYWIGGGPDFGFLMSAIQFPLLLVIAGALCKRFQTYSRQKKNVLALSLVFVANAFTIGVLLFTMDSPLLKQQMIPTIVVYMFLNLFSMWLAVFLVENIVEKNQMRAEITRKEKLHMHGELAASIAHEIRNPLTVVNGFLQLLRENDDRLGDDKRQMYLKMGIDELDRAEKIIANYLAFARPQLELVDTIDIAERIHHVSSIISSYALLRNVQIEKRTEDSLLVRGDREKIAQVLMNLLKNGIEAMPEGGTLTIQSSKRKDRILIVVQDTGIGMSHVETSNLGVPYYSTKEEGTGLGLMVCYQIIHSLGGTLHVTSEKNKGTQFRILLPAA